MVRGEILGAGHHFGEGAAKTVPGTILDKTLDGLCHSAQNRIMEQVINELTELNKKVDVIIGIMNKPENKFMKIMEFASNAVGIIGILAVVEIVRMWILGG